VPSEAYGGEAIKSQVFLDGISGLKSVVRMWKVMEEIVIQDLTEPMKMLKKCIIWCIQTVSQAYYVEILKQLHETMHRKWCELWSNNWSLHCDNCSRSQDSVKQFLAQKSITEM
jgi:uncharacterized membrane-anchored protein YjiN (DUF445 family)